MPDKRKVKFEREGDRLVRWLTCHHCHLWYKADQSFPPIHCGKLECATAARKHRRKSVVT
jgi:hypothetical protein